MHGGVAVKVAIMLAGVFEMNLGDSEVLTLFLAVVACLRGAGYGIHQTHPVHRTARFRPRAIPWTHA